VKKGNLFSIPYTMEPQRHPHLCRAAPPLGELYDRSCDQFDTLYDRGSTKCPDHGHPRPPLPYRRAPSHRLLQQIFDYIKKHDKVIFMTGSEILDWYKQASGFKG